MKKARVVLALTLLIFIALLVYYLVQLNSSKHDGVSKREQYQQELLSSQPNP